MVFAAIAGFALLHAPSCADGMSVATPHPAKPTTTSQSEHAGTAPMVVAVPVVPCPGQAVQAHTAGCMTGQLTEAALGAGGRASDRGDLGGVLTACLVFVMFVLVAVVGLRSALARGITVLTAARVAASRMAFRRPVSLAELCVMRT
ncbi:hypothetical protein GCM10012275_34500 [Longimycelium tulufanense]|uniref:Uncharacterized protein n=1 Tax=Longimycelium tulufanense TaxID=907463 RepID=A0A8J3CCV2_9PSEU|nr:hypothetical protein GCM10012275_34500 [Longimycelium tulufanense]